MSHELPAITSRELVGAMEKLGFARHHQHGSHASYYRESDGLRAIVPMHAGRDIKPKTLLSILHGIGLSPAALRAAL